MHQIAMVGAFIWRKGYEYALVAVREVVRRGYDVQVLIVGDGEERDRIEYTVQDLGLSDRVRLLGKQSPQEIVGVLQSSDLLLHSSLSEGIAGESGGLAEVIADGNNGFLTPSRDSTALADKVSLLLSDDQMRRRMGAAARRRAVAEFNIQQQGDSFVALYKSMLANRCE